MDQARYSCTVFLVGDKVGLPATASAGPGYLRISTEAGESMDLSLRACRFDKGGYDDGQLVVEGKALDGRAVLCYIPEPRNLARNMLAQGVAATPVLNRFAGVGNNRLTRIFIWTSALVVVGYLIYLGISAAGSYAVDFAVDNIPVSAEQELGKVAAADVLSKNRICSAPGINRALTAVGERLLSSVDSPPYDFHFYVTDSPDVNAFALPGGYVFVNLGLLSEASGPDEVAGVMAHEIQHALLRHGLRNVLTRAGLGLTVGLLFGDAGGLGGLVAGGAGELAALSFSRTQEEEADSGGLTLLYKSGFDPQGLPSFFEKLQDKEKEIGVTMPSFLSTHPETMERIRKLNNRIRAEGPGEVRKLELDWAGSIGDCNPVSNLDPTRDSRSFGAATE